MSYAAQKKNNVLRPSQLSWSLRRNKWYVEKTPRKFQFGKKSAKVYHCFYSSPEQVQVALWIYMFIRLGLNKDKFLHILPQNIRSEKKVFPSFRFEAKKPWWKRSEKLEAKRCEKKRKNITEIFNWISETHAKRIPFRFFSLISEKICLAKRAHPIHNWVKNIK